MKKIISKSLVQPRSEHTIFQDLAILCSSPGYIHAIAYFCFRDNTICYSGEMKSEDMLHLFSMSRLIRTEISTLIGLLLKNDIVYSLPVPDVMQHYITETETLLEEIHQAMSASAWSGFDLQKAEKFNPFTTGAVLREPIFYGGESAYSFQYRDLSPRKYCNDDEWLITNKGFSIHAARDVIQAICRCLEENSSKIILEMRKKPPEEWTVLPGNTFTENEILNYSSVDLVTVKKVLNAFTVPDGEKNDSFTALNDYNIANATPLIRHNGDSYILFHIYSLVEALYESPFYWMGEDKKYVNIAMQHRGLFTEEFSKERLALVFGRDNVHSNVDIFESKREKVSEIDVLVLFGSRAIVLQAKSKRLTLESRKGNDRQIRDDFKKSIQDSCDQAYKCAKLVGNPNYTFKNAHSQEIKIPSHINEVYVLCVVSDHYPALSFQAKQFLKFQASNTISLPFVMDIFTLDVMTEMLNSPLRFLSYVDRRTKYSDKLSASHELTILGYHLKYNLWLQKDIDMFVLHDDHSVDLDLSMTVRRESIPGKSTPDGILTRFASTTLGRFVKEIEIRHDPAIIDFGFMLLTLCEQTFLNVSNGIDELAERARCDGKNHDITIFSAQGAGFTVHCNNDSISVAEPALQRHCHLRKYTQKAQTWFGICVRPGDTSLRFGINLDYPWERSNEKDARTQQMAKPSMLSDLLLTSAQKKTKINRNDPCPCGSGKKYKKCCLF